MALTHGIDPIQDLVRSGPIGVLAIHLAFGYELGCVHLAVNFVMNWVVDDRPLANRVNAIDPYGHIDFKMK